MKNLYQMLDDVTLNSAKTLSISIPLVDGVDIKSMKDTLIDEAEKQLRRLADIARNNLLLKKYVYEIGECYKVSDIVLIHRVDIEDFSNLELKDNQFIVNAKGGY